MKRRRRLLYAHVYGAVKCCARDVAEIAIIVRLLDLRKVSVFYVYIHVCVCHICIVHANLGYFCCLSSAVQVSVADANVYCAMSAPMVMMPVAACAKSDCVGLVMMVGEQSASLIVRTVPYLRVTNVCPLRSVTHVASTAAVHPDLFVNAVGDDFVRIV